MNRFYKITASLATVILAMTGLQQNTCAQTYVNEPAKVVWDFNDANTFAEVSSVVPAGGFSATTFDLNGNTTKGTCTVTVNPGVDYVRIVPKSGPSDFVTWYVKPSKGLTFTPTRVSAFIMRNGTDAENTHIIVGQLADGTKIELGTFTAPRNNKTQADDKYGKNANYAIKFDISLTAEQQAQLTSADGFTLSSTLGVGNTKDAGLSDVQIEGVLNGTMANVAKYSLTATALPEEGGTVSLTPNNETFEEGTNVVVNAVKNFGYKFVNWTDKNGNVVSTEPEFTYTVNADDALTANFSAINTYALSYSVEVGNDYMVNPTPEPTMVDGKMMYEDGTEVILEASENPVIKFSNWDDGQTARTRKFKMTSDMNFVATYSASDFIAIWDFIMPGNSGRPADFASEGNDIAALSLVNENGDNVSWLDKSQKAAGGYEGRPAAVNWKTDGLGTYWWQTKLNASDFTNIVVSSAMVYNFNAYTKQNVEYSLDGTNWKSAGVITLEGAKNWKDAEFTLPSETDHAPALYIRWKSDTTSEKAGTSSNNDGIGLGAIYVTGNMSFADDNEAPVLLSTVPIEGMENASINGRVVLTFDEKVKVAENVKATLADVELEPMVSGKVVMFSYKNLSYGSSYTFTLPANSISDNNGNAYAQEIKINFTTRIRPEVNKTAHHFVVPDDGTIAEAIAAANNREDTSKRFLILVKKGTHVIPYSTTETTVSGKDGKSYPSVTTHISAPNISIIGESMEETIIVNDVDFPGAYEGTDGNGKSGGHVLEGIGSSDLFCIDNTATETYFQDITIKHGMKDATGRNVVVEDKSNKTIMKNVCLWGYQDTWTSNNESARYYFEGGVLRGRTDYLCGKGDAFFNAVTLQMTGTGGYLAVPSIPRKYGYIFKDCEITGESSNVDGNFTLGRPWGKGTPIALFIDTKMTARPSAVGWNEMSGGWPSRFAEYNSTTASGTVIDLSGRKKIFADTHENNPVLSKEEADARGYSVVMGDTDDWDPAALAELAPAPTNVVLNNTTKVLSWDHSPYAICWVVYKDGEAIGITTENSFNVETTKADEGNYSVRAANEMGGLGDHIVATIATAVEQISLSGVTSVVYYNLQGIRVEPSATPQVLVEVVTYADGTVKSSKVVK